MLKEWRHRRAVRRVKPGDGRALRRFRWWQSLSRVLFHLRLTGGDGRRTVYTVDARRGGDNGTGEFKADLYLDGRHHAHSGLPAVFPVRGGTIEVRMSAFGLKRCHYVTAEGTEHQLVPDPASAEGHRARLAHAHPTLSRWIGSFSATVLVAALVLLIPQIIEPLSAIPPVAERVGTFTSPVRLPLWLNITTVAATLTASTERALRLRYSRLLDGAAG
ncbi:hypothetical protein OG875_19045 [Streptomyces sp. NBC_01498]|uniref:hypothetical protein n=1 Tax=Streptomyces sp. NBC_01498 TaxID=2975870 RepID=UPI002E7C2EB5|nr:hypothetical protein [Streptomyces sp. NBC_01498]WTL26493.1 hypothetical protein OG875_19045 [Streptomyces sp. NBC_01498]